ncbi:MAG: hypothetical protein FJ134_05600 [Deltaproteobacteria bacterium]|nr:hypothetical protein [Deltaproteobacteria bacterium]
MELILFILLIILFGGFFTGVIKGYKGSRNVKKIPQKALRKQEPQIGYVASEILPNLKKSDFNFSEYHLSIYPINFSGQYSYSPNGRFVVGCQDSNYRLGTEGGHRRKGFGRVILFDGYQFVFQKDLERPNDGRVSDNGIVAVNDWRFGDGLKGIFYVLDNDGNTIINYPVKANLDKCGISEDATIAWCNTHRSNYDSHSYRLFLFFIPLKKLLFKIDCVGSPDNISLMDNEILVKRKWGNEHYDLKGKILNPEKSEEDLKHYTIEHGQPYELILLAKDMLSETNQISNQEADEIRTILYKILEFQGISDDYKALAYRFLGELSEKTGEIIQAIKNYRNALSLDPKVGVKRVLTKLERSMKK